MAENYGDFLAQKVAKRIHAPVAAETDLDTIAEDSRVDNMLCVVGSGSDRSVWIFASDDASPEVTGSVRVPAAGSGCWRKIAGGGAGSAIDWKDSVLAATTTALAANTRTGNVLLADANGALGTIDGVTLAVGSRLLVKDEATQANNGIYVIDSLGGASAKWQMTRAPDADSSAKVTPNLVVAVERGSIYADKLFELDVDSAITLNTTALTFIDFRGLATTSPTALDSGAAAVGTATTVARADHKHAVSSLNGASMGTVAEKSAGALANADFGVPQTLILNVPAGATANLDFTGAPFKFRIIDVVARKVGTSADAGDTVQLQTDAAAAITDAMALNVTGDNLVRAVSIDPTTHEIAAAGTLRVRRTQSTDAACKLHVTVLRVA